MFSEGDMYINLNAPVMDYKTFRATNVKAEVVFSENEVKLEKVFLNHAGGSMDVRGRMTNGAEKNPVTLNVNMQKMDVPALFSAFNNFGQDAVTNKNLKGRLSAIVHYNTSITNKANLVSADSDGSVEFLLEDGELNDFELNMNLGEPEDIDDIEPPVSQDEVSYTDPGWNDYVMSQFLPTELPFLLSTLP